MMQVHIRGVYLLIGVSKTDIKMLYRASAALGSTPKDKISIFV